jgi:hypothetical protein
MDILECLEDLDDHRFHLVLGKTTLIDNVLKKLPVGTKFQDDIIVVLVLEKVEELHNVRVMEAAVRPNLDLKARSKLFRVDPRPRNSLRSIEPSSLLMANKPHN